MGIKQHLPTGVLRRGDFSSLLLIAFAGFNRQWQDVQSWNQGRSAIVFIAMIALIDIYIYFELIRLKGPIYTSHANYFMVVSGVLWGMVIFAERPSSLMWVSAALLIASSYLIGVRKTGEDSSHAKQI